MSFGYLEDKIYCQFEGEQLTLYLKEEPNTRKCAQYLSAIEQLAHQKYTDIFLVLEYINQGTDRVYRNEVYELEKQKFLRLVQYRQTFLSTISSFEEKFFVKYLESLIPFLTPYLSELYAQYQSYLLPDSSATMLQIQELEQQIRVVEDIMHAESLEDIMENIPAYLYFRQNVE